MLQEEIQSMIQLLTEDKKAFRKFYKTGYFQYPNSEKYSGSVATVNNVVIAILEDISDRENSVAILKYKDNGVLIYKIFGEGQYFGSFGRIPQLEERSNYTAQVYSPTRKQILSDINVIRNWCKEANERAADIENQYIFKRFNLVLNKQKNEISKKDVLLMLTEMSDKLSRARKLIEREKISPKCNVSYDSIKLGTDSLEIGKGNIIRDE